MAMDTQEPLDIYQFMIEQAREIVFLLNQEGQFVYINEYISDVLGYDKQHLIGRHYTYLLHPDDVHRSETAYANCLNETTKPWAREIQLQFRHSHGKNNYHFFDVKLAAVPKELGKQYHDPVAEKRRLDCRLAFFSVARDISRVKELENIIHTNTNYDYLTGLPNRALLRDRVKQAMAHARREKTQFALMFIDLDGFKQVNDKLGHRAGDRLLQTIAARLSSCLREEDTLARVGGDEFVLLLPVIGTPDQASVIAEKLLNVIKVPVVSRGSSFALSASIGIVVYPKDGGSYDDLINAADEAMYHVKRRQKNGFIFYSKMHAGVQNVVTPMSQRY